MYYNIHTHPHTTDPDVVFIENIYKNFNLPVTGNYVSMGLHPWYLGEDTLENYFDTLRENASRMEVLAIGECGLDKLCDTEWLLQLKAFRYQIRLAEELGKPLIIHCVRAFNEVLTELNQIKVPVIFHGINNKLSLVQPIIDRGFHLSFGKSLLSYNEAILNTFRTTPVEKLFLETDDTDLNIREIYKSAAKIKDISEKDLVLQLEKNFLNVFQK